MNILLILVPLTLVLVIAAGWAFFWAVGNGQFDDLESSGWDAVLDDVAKSSSVPGTVDG